MKSIPKKCLTCIFVDFADDDLKDMRCYEPIVLSIKPHGISVKDDNICALYELDPGVIQDAKDGCW
jgi:hypothetical protein